MTHDSTSADDGGPVAQTPSNAHSHHSQSHSHLGNHHGHGHGHGNHAAASHSRQNAAAAAVEYGYPHGHIGFLTEAEEASFQEFKALIQEKGDYQPGPPPSHDDATLLRFLRARRWVVQDAYKQFKDTEVWRGENQLDVLYDSIDLEAYEQGRRLYPQWTGRRDRRGIPLYLFEISHLDSKTVSAYEKMANNTYSRAKPDGKTPPRLLRLFALYENLTRFVQPLCTEMPDRDYAVTTPITLSTNIVDVSGVSLRQFWNLKSHMQAASTLATAHYPETLDRIFIVGAPIFFSTVWGWVKRWFDPVTVSKIFILSHSEVLPTLLSFIDIKNIPKAYGGELDFNWGEMPNLDPAIRERAAWEPGFTEFPTGPLYWRPLGDGDRYECIAVGSKSQVERAVRVCTIAKHYQGAAAAEPSAAAAPAEPSAAVVPAEPSAVPTDAATNGQPAEAAAEAAAPDSAESSVAGVQNLTISEKAAEAKVPDAADAEPAKA